MAYQMPMQEDNLRRGPWLEEEDERLIAVVAVLGERRWDALAKASGLRRSGKSCRLRWMNHLWPNIKHGHITEEEERLIIQLHNQWGNKWSKIARRLPGRTDNEIKNYWRSHLSKKTLIEGQEFLANNVLLNNNSDKSSSSSISQCDALSPCSSNGYCISEKDDILGNIPRFSDTDELSNFAFTSSPYESMLSDWICNSPAEQSKMEQHEDWYCSLLDSSFCCPELLTVNNDISLWDSPYSIWNNVD